MRVIVPITCVKQASSLTVPRQKIHRSCLTSTMRTALGTFGKSNEGGEDDESRRRVPSIVEDAERTLPRIFKILLTVAPSMSLLWQAPCPCACVVRGDVTGMSNAHRQWSKGSIQSKYRSPCLQS